MVGISRMQHQTSYYYFYLGCVYARATVIRTDASQLVNYQIWISGDMIGRTLIAIQTYMYSMFDVLGFNM